MDDWEKCTEILLLEKKIFLWYPKHVRYYRQSDTLLLANIFENVTRNL